MSFGFCNIPPIKAYVKESFLTYEPSEKLVPCVFISAMSWPNQALTFQVLLSNGVLRDKLPIDAFLSNNNKNPEKELPLDFLQIWNCFSYTLYCYESFVSGLTCDVFLKNKKNIKGKCLFTFYWFADNHNEINTTWAEEPSEHKCGHFIALNNGQFAIQPNNRLRWYEPSFITEEFPTKNNYKTCKEKFSVEENPKWVTENNENSYFCFKNNEKENCNEDNNKDC